MNDSSPIRFASRELAEAIAKIHGAKTVAVRVPMVGSKDVSKLLRKSKAARSVAPSAEMRVK